MRLQETPISEVKSLGVPPSSLVDRKKTESTFRDCPSDEEHLSALIEAETPNAFP